MIIHLYMEKNKHDIEELNMFMFLWAFLNIYPDLHSPKEICFILLELFLKKFFNVYFLRETERERQSKSGGGTEREGDTESKAVSRLWAVSTEPHVEF